MLNRDDLYIGGSRRCVAGDATISVGNPATEGPTSQAPAGCAKGVDRAVRNSARVRAGEPVPVAGLSAVLGARQAGAGGVPDTFERMRAGIGARSVIEFDA